MIIPVEVAAQRQANRKLPPQFAQFGADEVVLLELQGSLDVEGHMNGQFVGKLSIDEETNKPSLFIGHHLLEGKLMDLPKPLAVMNRVPSESAEDDVPSSDASNDRSHSVSTAPPKWEIVAVVKRKMVFAKRPMPMVGKATTLDPGKDKQR